MQTYILSEGLSISYLLSVISTIFWTYYLWKILTFQHAQLTDVGNVSAEVKSDTNR